MSNDWLRLWHDLPNDPKWRTIAKLSKQPITAVISVYIHMLVCASNATERGRTQGWCDEDVATALDLETDHVIIIRETMQGRVLDGDHLKGWEKRQPKKEDGSAERSKAWREKQKREKEEKEMLRTPPNAPERKQPTDTEQITTNNVVVINKSLSNSPREDLIVDNSFSENTIQDFSEKNENENLSYFVCLSVVSDLMGRKLHRKEQEAVSEWVVTYPMQKALEVFDKELIKYRNKHSGNSPPVMYFTPIFQNIFALDTNCKPHDCVTK